MRTPTGDAVTLTTTTIAVALTGHHPHRPPVCIRCGQAAHVHHTTSPADAGIGEAGPGETHTIVCPSCLLVAAGVRGGEVRLVGGFVSEYQPEIERLIRQVVLTSAEDDPDGRVLRFDRPQRGRMTVTTTSERLARRIGQALRERFRGTVHCDVARERAFTRVTWLRDE